MTTMKHEMGQALEVSAQKLQATGEYAALFEQAFGSAASTTATSHEATVPIKLTCN